MVTRKSFPSEMLEALNAFNTEGRPIWEPLHLQPMYQENEFITVNGRRRGGGDAYIGNVDAGEVTTDILERGFCLPRGNKMMEEVQNVIIVVIKACFE